MVSVKDIKISIIVYMCVGVALTYIPIGLILSTIVNPNNYLALAIGIGAFFILLGLLCIVDLHGRIGGLFETILAPIPGSLVVIRFFDSIGVGIFFGIYILLVLIYLDFQLRKYKK